MEDFEWNCHGANESLAEHALATEGHLHKWCHEGQREAFPCLSKCYLNSSNFPLRITQYLASFDHNLSS